MTRVQVLVRCPAPFLSCFIFDWSAIIILYVSQRLCHFQARVFARWLPLYTWRFLCTLSTIERFVPHRATQPSSYHRLYIRNALRSSCPSGQSTSELLVRHTMAHLTDIKCPSGPMFTAERKSHLNGPLWAPYNMRSIYEIDWGRNFVFSSFL